MTEEFLKKEIWWWHKDSTAKRPHDFKKSNSLAFNYEIARRDKRKLRLQAFPFVEGLCGSVLKPLDDTPLDRLPHRAAQDKAIKEKSWLLAQKKKIGSEMITR